MTSNVLASSEASKTSEMSSKEVLSNPLSKKLNKILETRLDNDKEVLDALKSLSLFFNENNIRTRRSLRSDIEKRTVAINENFIEAFSVVRQKLDEVHNEVQAMNQCCKDMTSRLKETKSQTHDLIGQTTKLQMEGQKLQLRSQMVEVFLKRFQLSEHEILALKGTKDGQLHQDFFATLARVKQIHNDCKILLRTSHQTAGLEIMESMALHQEAGYERLYRWTQNECCQLTNDNADVSSQLCQAINALQDRPVLFKYSLDEFSSARRTAVVRAFIDAMTRGGVMGGTKNSRPIELHSHDPLRYLGDMLAWVHQACASEREHVTCLLKNVQMDKMEETIQDMLQHITEGVCRPFKMRIEQVLTSEQSVTTLYKLANLLHFYKGTIGQMLPGEKGGLVFLLDESVSLSFKLFFSALSLTASRLLDSVEVPPSDLSPPSTLITTLNLLKDILSSDEQAVAVSEDREGVCVQILSTIIDPLLQMCSLSASNLDSISMATYMLNNLHLIETSLALFQHTQAPMEMLQAQMEAQVQSLVADQASSVLNRCNLASVCTALQGDLPNKLPLSTLAGMDAASLKQAMSSFDKYLSDTASLTLPQCSHIHSSKYRKIVRKRSADLIGRAYKQLYEGISDPANQYPPVQTIAPLSPEQVLKLLN